MDLHLTPVISVGVVSGPHRSAHRQFEETRLLSGLASGCLLGGFAWLDATANGIPALQTASRILRVDEQQTVLLIEEQELDGSAWTPRACCQTETSLSHWDGERIADVRTFTS